MKIIALDCDDVLTDYNKRWAELYAEFFQLESFPVVKPNAHYNTVIKNLFKSIQTK